MLTIENSTYNTRLEQYDSRYNIDVGNYKIIVNEIPINSKVNNNNQKPMRNVNNYNEFVVNADRQYNMYSDTTLTSKFNYYNKSYFNNALKVDNLGFCTNIDKNYLGVEIHYTENGQIKNTIAISPTISDNYDNVLLHEMCHLYSSIYDLRDMNFELTHMDSHDYPLFVEQVNRLKSLGLEVAGY